MQYTYTWEQRSSTQTDETDYYFKHVYRESRQAEAKLQAMTNMLVAIKGLEKEKKLRKKETSATRTMENFSIGKYCILLYAGDESNNGIDNDIDSKGTAFQLHCLYDRLSGYNYNTGMSDHARLHLWPLRWGKSRKTRNAKSRQLASALLYFNTSVALLFDRRYAYSEAGLFNTKDRVPSVANLLWPSLSGGEDTKNMSTDARNLRNAILYHMSILLSSFSSAEADQFWGVDAAANVLASLSTEAKKRRAYKIAVKICAAYFNDGSRNGRFEPEDEDASEDEREWQRQLYQR